ncbi:alpha-(1,3)-fucosyltransferase 7-like [Seriola dumerili]|uniref:Fucosyltransferase n=1 Tax=Seriola dumerili TaxID=41447 RepID=A0A3B4TRS8_SERDU|nr:alpha-(1,3)-fucosyltransferase 7-like [Seriola dumerili]
MGQGNTKKTLLSSMKKGILFCILCVVLLCLFTKWPSELKTLAAKHPSTFFCSSSSSSSSSRNVTTILLWYWPFRKSYSLQGDVCWDLYRIPYCRLVDQHSFFSSADVVVFHNRELLEGHQKLPLDLPRPQHQRWAWMSLESPLHNGNLRKYAGIFNITITYRRDADVSLPYGELIPKEAEELVGEDAALNKSSLVCWVVSNYLTHHKRSEVYHELKAVVPVKVYGHWTKAHLTSGALLPTISRCYFYLAFENSIAKDYITEKLWRNAYLGGAVPVVLGPSLNDYKTVAPPHSFIHVDEFASVKDLGKYLQQLAEDRKRYSEYFTWKQQWKVKLYTDWRERLCKICSQYNSFPQQKYYTDLEAWVKANI